jgi:hypothetical protein
MNRPDQVCCAAKGDIDYSLAAQESQRVLAVNSSSDGYSFALSDWPPE